MNPTLVLMRVLTNGPMPVDVIWEEHKARDFMSKWVASQLNGVVGEPGNPVGAWAVDADAIVSVQIVPAPKMVPDGVGPVETTAPPASAPPDYRLRGSGLN